MAKATVAFPPPPPPLPEKYIVLELSTSEAEHVMRTCEAYVQLNMHNETSILHNPDYNIGRIYMALEGVVQ